MGLVHGGREIFQLHVAADRTETGERAAMHDMIDAGAYAQADRLKPSFAHEQKFVDRKIGREDAGGMGVAARPTPVIGRVPAALSKRRLALQAGKRPSPYPDTRGRVLRFFLNITLWIC